MLALTVFGLNPYSARAVSFLVAVTSTWAMNRTFTFGRSGSSPPASLFMEWLRFCAANAMGGLVNLGTYVLLLNSVPVVRQYPVLGVAAGSLSGLLVNFTLSKLFVFRTAPPCY
jgi:putative flippase GtrA